MTTSVNLLPQNVQRRLAALFSADVAGYTRLMQADEIGTLRILSAHRSDADRSIQQHGGRIANTAGDSILAEFPSAADAINCALRIHESMAVLNAELPSERQVRFRIGIHVGEAIVRDGDLFGDGVNIAARMQSVADPGTVCVSAAAHHFAHKVIAAEFHDLGDQIVKNIDEPIRAYLVRPSGPPPERSLPPVHRQSEFYLARRFHDVLFDAVKPVLDDAGITRFELGILSALSDVPEIPLVRLADRLYLPMNEVQALAGGLAVRGLVQLAPADSNGSAILALTPAGKELFATVYPASVAVRDRVMASLSTQERVTLHGLLGRVIKANEARSGD